MGTFRIHPYRGYINTVFSFKSDIAVDVVDGYDNSTYRLKQDENLQIRLKAGTHIFKCETLNLERTVIVEDAYRFGGSLHKCSFVFDDCPWCVVVMKDRSYFYNRETEESFMEAISPDTIKCVSEDMLLLENDGEKGKSLFSMVTCSPLLQFENEIYIDKNVIICKEDGILQIHKISGTNVEDFTTPYDSCYYDSINAYIYIYKSHNIKALNVKSLEITNWEISDKIKEVQFIGNKFAAFLSDTTYGATNLTINNILKQEYVCTLLVPCLSSINGKKYIDYRDMQSIFTSEFEKAFPSFGRSNLVSKITFTEYDFYIAGEYIYYIENLVSFQNNQFGKIRRAESACLKSTKCDLNIALSTKSCRTKVTDELFIVCDASQKTYIIQNGNIVIEGCFDVYVHNNIVCINTDMEGQLDTFGISSQLVIISDKKYSLEYYDRWGIVGEDGEYFIGDVNYRYILGTGELKEKIFNDKHIVLLLNEHIIAVDGHTFFGKEIPCAEDISAISSSGNYVLSQIGTHTYLYDKEHNRKEILESIDRTSYGKVWMSEFGDSFLCQDGEKTSLIDLEGGEEITNFDNVNFVSHYNGYRPLFRIDRCRRPVMVDPLSKASIDNKYLGQYIFLSPDGKLYADTALGEYVKYMSLIKDVYIPKAEYEDLRKKYDNGFYDSENEKTKKEEERIAFVRANKSYFYKIYKKLKPLGKPAQQKDIENYFSKKTSFVETFIEVHGFAHIKKTDTKETIEEIPLGPPLWFINYVSFSYDNRYVALAGRYPNDTEKGGLFLVYDLHNHKKLYDKQNSWAVWTTAFTKDGVVAAYSSNPITFLCKIRRQSNVCNVCNFEDINDRNFLTFSPDGKYYALSNQGYIAYNSKRHEECHCWGHMPSCDVYVRKVGFDDELEFSDLSDSGIEGISTRKYNRNEKTVASVSFSNDNNKLMMVGRDGVVIIRNLHLNDFFHDDDNNPEKEDMPIENGYYWGTKVEMAGGYIIHNDEPEWLRDIADTELKDAYVDEYGVRYSKDKKVLLDCNCTLDEYNIPSGVVEIREKAFFTAKIGIVHLPWTVKSIGYRGLFSYGIENIECSNANSSFMSWHGVLYSKDMKTLVAYPQGRKDVLYRLPKKTLKIADGVFSTLKDTLHMQEAHSVMSMNTDAYESCGFCSAREEQFLHDNQGIINYPYVIIWSNAKGIFVNECVVSNEMCYVDEKGVVYDWKKKKLLIFHPALRIEDYTVIDGCEEIGEEAFPSFGFFDPRTQGGESISNRSNSIKCITLPASLHRVSGNPFKDCAFLMSIYVPNGDVERFKAMLPQELHSKIKPYCKN